MLLCYIMLTKDVCPVRFTGILLKQVKPDRRKAVIR